MNEPRPNLKELLEEIERDKQLSIRKKTQMTQADICRMIDKKKRNESTERNR